MRTNQLCSCILAQSVCVIHPTEIFTDSLRLMSRALEAAEHTVRLGGTETEAFDGAAPHGCSRGRGNREADAHRGGARLVECRGRVMTNTGEIRSEFSVRIPFEEFVKQPAWQSLPLLIPGYAAACTEQHPIAGTAIETACVPSEPPPQRRNTIRPE
jgi:hypothetical protein